LYGVIILLTCIITSTDTIGSGCTLLRNSFIHIPGIGPSTERWLWENGLWNWSDCLTRKTSRLCGYPMTSNLRTYALDSENNLRNGNALYFDHLLPKSESWRMYADFRDNTAFVDIETTGFRGQEEITVIGLSDGRKTKVFVRGINLVDFKDEIRKYALLVTYNGKQFDVPVMSHTFGNIFAHIAHFDLRYAFQRLGYVGGLKTIQDQLGFRRDGILNYLDGRSAIWLWEEYQKGNKKALNTLLRYNLEDVVVLQSLAESIYNEASSTLPVPVKALSPGDKPLIDIRHDEELVRKLARNARLVPSEPINVESDYSLSFLSVRQPPPR
jgi:uncharacterized protein YprB with RNaseH-like and TPR domain